MGMDDTAKATCAPPKSSRARVVGSKGDSGRRAMVRTLAEAIVETVSEPRVVVLRSLRKQAA